MTNTKANPSTNLGVINKIYTGINITTMTSPASIRPKICSPTSTEHIIIPFCSIFNIN